MTDPYYTKEEVQKRISKMFRKPIASRIQRLREAGRRLRLPGVPRI